METQKPEPQASRSPLPDYPRGPARIRLPRRIIKGEVIRVQAKIRHPSRTGLRMIGEHQFGPDPENPAVYLRSFEVYYGEAKLLGYEMTSALSDDPIVTFTLRATREAPVRVVFASSEGKVYEASAPVRFTAE